MHTAERICNDIKRVHNSAFENSTLYLNIEIRINLNNIQIVGKRKIMFEIYEKSLLM